MKKYLLLVSWLFASLANAQLAPFVPGQILTAAQLNSAFALYAPLTGAAFTGPVALPAGSSVSGYLTSANAASIYAPLASPTFTGTPVVPGYLTTGSASSIYAPIASPTFSGTVTIPTGAVISGYAPLASPVFTGSPVVPGYLTTVSASSTYAPLASPTFTGTPTVPGYLTTASASTIYAPIASPTFTGLITPASATGIKGTAVADNAQTGSIGEYVASTSTSTGITTSTSTNITSISLTAGDWDVQGNLVFSAAAGAAMTNNQAGVNTTSATLPASPQLALLAGATLVANATVSLLTPPQRINVAATTTVYLVGFATFSTNTVSTLGILRARRIR